MQINLSFVHAERIGYGRLGVYLGRELERMSVTVYDLLPAPPETGLGRDPKETDGRNPGISNVACWVSTPSHARGWWTGQIPVMFTMYEAMQLPASFTENLHEFETVIVPSRQNQELFSAFHDNVRFLPLGVDPEQWHYTPRPALGRDFVFLIGGSGPRKGTDLAYDAFVKVFGPDGSWGDGPIPHLWMKSPRGREVVDHPRVLMIPGYLSADEEVALYEQAHVYLQPSRGEGFGLQPLQAIAQGIPTILTAAHGHDSFAHLGYGLSSTPHPAEYFMFGDSGDWWEPDFDELCDRMRWVYDNYTEATEFARQSAATVAAEFTWQRCAEGFLDIVGRDRLVGYQGDGTWHEPVSKLYEVVVTQDRMVDIGGTKRLYRAGQIYWEPADVKRVLFDNGSLDPVCLKTVDAGLSAEQLGAVEEYSAAHAYCPHCHQRLGTQPTKADDLYAEAVAG